jgi:pyridoxamine 5'-phosphate oxidase
MSRNIADIRQDYSQQVLNRHEVDPNPVRQFNNWFEQAIDSNITDVNAFTLSTADKNGRPSGRILLLKGVEDEKFIFYTNYESQKANEISVNPFGAITFYWKELERQVRIQGKIEKTDKATSDNYFQTRPRKSRIGAWISPQSRPIPSRIHLIRAFVAYSMKLMGGRVELPPYWGGYALEPDRIEFWQGRPNRLHDRVNYELVNGIWKISRLAP